MPRLAALLLCLALLPLGAAEPVFRIRVTLSGRSGDASYTSNLEIRYAPCAIWVGGSGGGQGSPEAFLEKAGGLAAIRPGQSLPFYAHTTQGSAQGSDGSAAEVVTRAPGIAYWREWNSGSSCDKLTDAADRPDHQQSARFTRTAKGARIADFDLGLVSAGLGGYIGAINLYAMDIDGQQVTQFCVFELTNEELANFKRVDKTKRATFTDGNGSVSVTAQLTAELEDPGEVDVEILDDYDAWMPRGDLDNEDRPGNAIRLKATVRATGQPGAQADRKARIFFELADVGSEPGVCLNWPLKPAAGKADLRLLRGENPKLEADPAGLEDFNLRSKGLVKEAELKVSAFDFGAWGLVKVRAEDKDGKPLKVTYRGKDQNGLALPRDEDHNHIADAWQNAKGVFGLPSNWDEAEVAGQDQKGDGFGLYQKYRGLVVATAGGRKHTQLEPREKAHFFIDAQNLIDLDQWWRSTGIRGYKVLAQWTQQRRVDVHRSFGTGAGKWASRFDKDETEVPTAASEAEQETARMQWAFTKGDENADQWKPSQVESCRVFPGRVRFVLRELKIHMLVSLKIPETPNEYDTAAFLQGLGLSKLDLIKRIEALDEATFSAVAAQVTKWAAIHEACHACGVNGHLNAKNEEDADCANRVPDCPMQYPTKKEKLRLLLFGEMAGSGRCCSTAPHLCFKNLSPKG